MIPGYSSSWLESQRGRSPRERVMIHPSSGAEIRGCMDTWAQLAFFFSSPGSNPEWHWIFLDWVFPHQWCNRDHLLQTYLSTGQFNLYSSCCRCPFQVILDCVSWALKLTVTANLSELLGELRKVIRLPGSYFHPSVTSYLNFPTCHLQDNYMKSDLRLA